MNQIDLQFDPYWVDLKEISEKLGAILYPKVSSLVSKRAKVFEVKKAGPLNNYFNPKLKNQYTGQEFRKEYQALDIGMYQIFYNKAESKYEELAPEIQKKYDSLKKHISNRLVLKNLINQEWRKRRKILMKPPDGEGDIETSKSFWKQIRGTKWFCYYPQVSGGFYNSYISFSTVTNKGVCLVKVIDMFSYEVEYLGTAVYHPSTQLLVITFDKKNYPRPKFKSFVIETPNDISEYDHLFGFLTEKNHNLASFPIVIAKSYSEVKFNETSYLNIPRLIKVLLGQNEFQAQEIYKLGRYNNKDFAALIAGLNQRNTAHEALSTHINWDIHYLGKEYKMSIMFRETYTGSVTASITFDVGANIAGGASAKSRLNANSTILFNFSIPKDFPIYHPLYLNLNIPPQKSTWNALVGTLHIISNESKSYSSHMVLLTTNTYGRTLDEETIDTFLNIYKEENNAMFPKVVIGRTEEVLEIISNTKG